MKKLATFGYIVEVFLQQKFKFLISNSSFQLAKAIFEPNLLQYGYPIYSQI